MSILNNIQLPEEIKSLSQKDLYHLSDEVREKIIEVVASNGGHLSSNLGVVELTVAIHASLNSPQDRILWDVGHQSYAHKVLTGRLGRFDTLRQYNGLSGFIKREESKHDIFGVGHAATSISAALGIAKARDLNGEKYSVLSVIGDSSISSGEAFEAINNINTVKGPFIIVLNDNEMSISSPVGVLSDHITSLRYNPVYRGFKRTGERVMLKLPHVGKPLVKSVDKLLRRTKHALINYEKIGVIYEELGIRYLGPIEATNIPHIMGAIRHAKNAREPVLIHILSKKGHGYKPAEENPTKFHGLGKFDAKTGEVKKIKGPKTYTQFFGDKLLKCASKDKKIVAIAAAMTEGTGLAALQKKYPDRCVDVGISEEHAVTFAGGLAVEGMKPLVVIYSTFVQRSFDQIIHDIALQKLPVIFAMDRAGIVGEDGPTHHGTFDLPYMRMIPNMTIMAPKDGAELEQMLDFSLAHTAGPISMRYPRGATPETKWKTKSTDIELGKGECLLNPEKADVLAIAIGSMVDPVYRMITENNFKVKLINARFLKPLDTELLNKMSKGCKTIISYEEGVKQGGLYSAVSEWVQEAGIKAKVIGNGLDFNTFVTHGNRAQLLKDHCMSDECIAKELKEILPS